MRLDTPDGAHTLMLDGFGRPARVTRAGIGSVIYDYHPGTGLLARKQHLDTSGAVAATSDTDHDAIGRPIHVAQTSVTTATDLFFDYDGHLDGSTQPGGVSLSPGQIRFSQSSVNGVDDLVASMKVKGWDGPPVDVVRMADGGLTSFDNTRILAASRAGINVRAVIHEASEAFPAGRWTPKSGIVPKSWGEAVEARIQQQNKPYRIRYPMGSHITGSVE